MWIIDLLLVSTTVAFGLGALNSIYESKKNKIEKPLKEENNEMYSINSYNINEIADNKSIVDDAVSIKGFTIGEKIIDQKTTETTIFEETAILRALYTPLSKTIYGISITVLLKNDSNIYQTEEEFLNNFSSKFDLEEIKLHSTHRKIIEGNQRSFVIHRKTKSYRNCKDEFCSLKIIITNKAIESLNDKEKNKDIGAEKLRKINDI